MGPIPSKLAMSNDSFRSSLIRINFRLKKLTTGNGNLLVDRVLHYAFDTLVVSDGVQGTSAEETNLDLLV